MTHSDDSNTPNYPMSDSEPATPLPVYGVGAGGGVLSSGLGVGLVSYRHGIPDHPLIRRKAHLVARHLKTLGLWDGSTPITIAYPSFTYAALISAGRDVSHFNITDNNGEEILVYPAKGNHAELAKANADIEAASAQSLFISAPAPATKPKCPRPLVTIWISEQLEWTWRITKLETPDGFRQDFAKGIARSYDEAASAVHAALFGKG